jgi:hypothetical protein
VLSYRTGRSTHSARHQYHYQRRSQQSDSQSSIPPSFTAYLPSYDSPSLSSRHAQHQSSNSTLSSHTKNSSSQLSPRALHPQASMPSIYSGEDIALEAEINEQAVHPQEPNSFVDRFRALISQIRRETDLGIEYARPDIALDEDDHSFSMPPIPPAVGYDEFGRPYPPEQQVSFLNGYIRRMPTIESMGSREMGSISTGLTTSRRSTATFSRPTTQLNTFTVSEYSSAGSHPMSQDSSFVACEMPTVFGRTNEIGELVDRSEDGHDPSRRRSGATMSGNTTSTSTSYYSATSSTVPSATEDVQFRPPGLDEPDEAAREHARPSSRQEFIN